MNRSLMARGEEDNQTISTWGDVEGDFPHARPHYDIPWFDQMIDFPSRGKGGGRRLSILFG